MLANPRAAAVQRAAETLPASRETRHHTVEGEDQTLLYRARAREMRPSGGNSQTVTAGLVIPVLFHRLWVHL